MVNHIVGGLTPRKQAFYQHSSSSLYVPWWDLTVVKFSVPFRQQMNVLCLVRPRRQDAEQERLPADDLLLL